MASPPLNPMHLKVQSLAPSNEKPPIHSELNPPANKKMSRSQNNPGAAAFGETQSL